MKCIRTIGFMFMIHDFKVLSYLIQQLIFRQSIHILHHTIIIHYLQLIIGEMNRQEKVIFLLAGMIRICLSSLLANKSSSSSPVMSISNISGANGGK